MNKDINVVIEETKIDLLNFVNEKLQSGIPISVMNLIMENMIVQVKKELDRVVEENKNKEVEETE